MRKPAGTCTVMALPSRMVPQLSPMRAPDASTTSDVVGPESSPMTAVQGLALLHPTRLPPTEVDYDNR